MLFAIILIIIISIVSEEAITPSMIYQKLVWVIMGCIGAVCAFRSLLKKEVPDYVFLVVTLVPLAVTLLYTAVYGAFAGDELGVTTQAFTTVMYGVVCVLMAMALMHIFSDKSVDLLCISLVLSYTGTFIRGLQKIGVQGLWKHLTRAEGFFDYAFERHDIGVAVVPLIFYYLYNLMNNKKEKNDHLVAKLIVLFLVVFLCGKRSAILALFAGGVVMGLFWLAKSKADKAAKCVMALCVVLPFAYVCIIKIGLLQTVAEAIGINSMGRVEVFGWFEDQYTLSPLYIGKGFQYIHQYMKAGLGSALVNAYQYLHNTILQLYIETGFFGFFFWFGHLAVGMPLLLKRFSDEKSAQFYLIVIAGTIAMFTVDNVLTYPLYQVCMHVVVASVALKRNGLSKI